MPNISEISLEFYRSNMRRVDRHTDLTSPLCIHFMNLVVESIKHSDIYIVNDISTETSVNKMSYGLVLL